VSPERLAEAEAAVARSNAELTAAQTRADEAKRRQGMEPA
jgi:hypothetical protein